MDDLIPIEEIIDLIKQHKRYGPPFEQRMKNNLGWVPSPRSSYWFEKEGWYTITFVFRIQNLENGHEDAHWSVEARFKDKKFQGEIRNIQDNGTSKQTSHPE